MKTVTEYRKEYLKACKIYKYEGCLGAEDFIDADDIADKFTDMHDKRLAYEEAMYNWNHHSGQECNQCERVILAPISEGCTFVEFKGWTCPVCLNKKVES